MIQNYLISSGEKNRGKNSTMSGNTMMAISTTNIGISMIMVSLIAKLIGTLATAQDIMRHMPYGGVMRPKAKDTMPTMAKCTGCMPTDSANGCKVVPTMMMAGMASKKQPTTNNAKLPFRHVGQQCFRNLVIGQQPAKDRRSTDAK
jgi:hypothetical protein